MLQLLRLFALRGALIGATKAPACVDPSEVEAEVCDVVRSQQATSLFSLVFIPKVIPVSLWGFFDSKLKPFFPPRSRHRQTEDSYMLWASANSVLLSGNLK